jgi:signal transduction histidine kinase
MGSLVTERLAQVILADLQVIVVHADAELQILAHTADLDVCSRKPDADLKGQSLTSLFPELVGLEGDLRAVALGHSPRFDLPQINRLGAEGGDWCYVSLTALPHPEDQGRLVVLVQDVTTEGRLEQQVMQQLNELRLLRSQLETANKELLRLNEEKSAFLHMAAHDLRSPLTIVRGYVDMALAGLTGPLSEDTIRSLNVVLDRAKAMTRLIDNLLDVEKIESGDVALQLEQVDLAQLVERTGRNFKPLAEEKGQSLLWQFPAEVPLVCADQDRITQVLENLVNNALKFTPAGGQIIIEVLVQDADITIEVRDTGLGISDADQAHLFQRFFRADEARKQGITGTGLGLSIAQAIVEQHGGRIYCRSQIGQGSTFGFSLPAHRE